MEQSPKLIYFTRTQYARLSAAKQAMDDIMLTSFAGSGIGALTTYTGGGKVELLLPLISGLFGLAARIVRNQLSFYMTIGQISDPILLDQTVIVKDAVTKTGDGT